MATDSTNSHALSVEQRLWRLLEPFHALVYFAPEHREACDRLGLKGGWMAYFASRAAPLGEASALLVTALFYNFHPGMVRRAIPDAWALASAGEVLAARYTAVDRALIRVLGSDLARATEPVAALARAAAETGDPAGRPMFAANAALEWPDTAPLALWHAATLLREHRGDGHVATLVSEGVDGCQAHVLQVAADRNRRADLQRFRGWSDDDWSRAVEELRVRGWLDPDGQLTRDGRSVYRHIETRTDQLAAAPYRVLGADTERLAALMAPLTEAVLAGGHIPYPNPMGVPAPAPTE